MNKLIFGIFILISVFVTNPIFSQIHQGRTLRIDIDNANGTSFSNLFKSAVFVPLESNKSSLFGKIDQLEVTEDFFLILDFDTNCILCFDKTGKFKFKIEGGRQYVNRFDQAIISFSIDYSKRFIVVNWKGGTRTVFDFEGKKVQEFQKIYFQAEYIYLNGASVFYKLKNLSKNFDISWALPVTTVKEFSLNGFIRDQVFSNSDMLSKQGKVFFETPNNDSITLFSRPFDYNIYSISSTSLSVIYKVILPAKYSLPNGFVGDSSLYNKRALYLIRDNPRKIFSISAIFDISKLLFFELSSVTNRKEFSLLFDKEKEELITLAEIETDEGNHYLSTKYLARQGFHASRDNFLYSSFPANEFKKSYTNTLMKRNSYSKEYTSKIFDNISETSNPVIVQLSLK